MSYRLLREFLAQRRRDARTEQLDRAHELGVREGRGVHLKCDTRDTAQCLTVSNDLLDHFVRLADNQGAERPTLCVEAGAGHGRPAALSSDRVHRAGVAGKEVIRGFLVRGCDVAEGVDADLEPVARVSRALAGL